MPSITNIITPRVWDRKRIAIALLIAATIALFFWTQSRVPALNTKAQMGQRTVVTSLAFDVVLPVTPDQPWPERVASTAVNWGYTNWKGMTFGVLFAAAFFVILAYLPRHEFKGRMLNTLKGVVTGIPLGVCVNCTTPIAHGMYQAGVRLETVLATLVSSPTLNVIVLSMSFSLLPFQYAVGKVLGVMLFVMLVIPLVARLGKPSLDADTRDRVETQLDNSPYRKGVIEPVGGSERGCEIDERSNGADAGWGRAIQDVATDFLRALWFVFRTTVPFMLLAGVLGAAVIELVPVNDLVTLPNTLLMALLVAAIGAFLPVPIAFDVVIVSLLIASGVPVLFSMTLLFVLGIFSIYPFLILWRNVSPRVSLGLFLGTIVVGLGCGYGLQAHEQWTTERVIAAYEKNSQEQAAALPVEKLHSPTVAEIHAQDVAIATRICKQHDHPVAQVLCLADFMFSEFEKGSDDRLCQTWQGEENRPIREFCLADYKEKRLVKAAESQRDAGICDALPSGAKRFQCLEKVIIARITTGDGIALCRELPTARMVSGCLQQGIVIRLDKFNDPESCKQFETPQEVAECFTNARVLDLAGGRRLENCNALSDAGERGNCRRVVAFSMIDDGADAAVCQELADTVQQQACIAHAATVKAADAGDAGLCAVIDNPQSLEVCRRVAINQQITQAINRAAMQRIGNVLPGILLAGAAQTNAPAQATASGGGLIEADFYSGEGISISQIPYVETGDSGKGFTRRSGVEFGIGDVWPFSLLEFVSPFMGGRGIAAGDFDNDHLPDVILAASDGVHLFRNTGKGGFTPHPVDLTGRVPDDAYVVALVDVDNDGWQDIFVTGYGGRVSVVLNDGAGFKNPETFDIPNAGANLAISAAFTDLDRDGDLELMLGNWSFGEDKSFLENYSGNRLLRNTPGGFQHMALDEVRGDSLSILFSDLDGDGDPDLSVGNDREIPDMYFLGDGSGALQRVMPDDGRIPATPFNTMSIESADFNNDLQLDLFSTDMTFAAGQQTDYCEAVSDASAAQRCHMLLAGRERIKRRDLAWCGELQDDADRDACLTAIYRSVVIDSKQGELCEKIPDRYQAHRVYCRNLARNDVREENFSVANNLQQVQSNILLLGEQGGRFRNMTEQYGVGSSFWSWNARAADLDNDGWQDIYIGNGFRFGEDAWEIHSNVFFHNQGGERFATAQAEFGLEDFVNTPSYVYIDFDFDGDLDILATGLLSPTRLFVNRESANNAISFAVRDYRGNRFGIGSKLTIRYQQDGEQRHQLRELKASGGFMSFDPTEARFGLGEQDQISRLEIDWSTGEKTIIDKPLPAGRHYIVTRGK